jgi:PAS domain S-box-containing protein
MKSSLRTKLLLSVGISIFVVLGTNTSIHIQQLKRDYLEAIEWRSEALARGLLEDVPFIKSMSPSANIQEVLEALSPLCSLLYEANKEKNVAHVAVINADGMIVAHSDINFWKTLIDSPLLLKHLQRHELTTVLDGGAYHTFVPIFGVLRAYLGAIDIGIPKEVVDEKVRQLLFDSVGVFGVFLIVTVIAISMLMSMLVAKPIESLMTVMKEIESGNFDIEARIATNDELGKLAGAFNRMGFRLKESFQNREQLLAELQTLNQELEQRVERRTAELARQKYILDTFMENVPDSIYFKDRESQIIRANKALAVLLGLHDPAEAVGKTDFDFFPTEQAQVKYEQEQEIIRTGQPILSLEEPNSGENWSLTTKMPLRDEHGTIIGTFGISRDITKLKQTETALKYAKNKAEEAQKVAEAANRAKSEFLTNMSHELRTPLNVILGLAQIMTRNPHIPDDERENLDLMRHSGEHLLMLINNILDMSKIEAGHISLNERNFDLFRLLDELHEMFILKVDQKRLHLEFECTEDVPQYICTDDTKLRQVLMNLLNNAVKFTEEGGVTVRIENCQLNIENCKETTLAPQSSIVNLQFSVSDTGPGIAADEIETLFEAFGQTQTGRQVQEGTGLGLTISRKFVQLMGGELAVHSDVGHGTTFALTIPVRIVTAADVTTPPSTRRVIALEPGQPHYRVLVVDDKPDNRCLIVKLLVPLGFDIREAANGQEALELWKEFEPHLIWMDMRMPVMDGYEATKRIREAEEQKLDTGYSILDTGIKHLATSNQHPASSIQHPASSIQYRTPIIALTASSFEDDRTTILSIGCDDYICKPFQETEIFEIMHKHLGIRYVYEESSKVAGSKVAGGKQKAEDVLTLDALAELSEEIYRGLRQSVEMGDVEMAEGLIERIRQQNAPMAKALTDLVKQFRFDLLQELFKLSVR